MVQSPTFYESFLRDNRLPYFPRKTDRMDADDDAATAAVTTATANGTSNVNAQVSRVSSAYSQSLENLGLVVASGSLGSGQS